MFASKVIISEETRAKNQISKRQQGKLRYQKLVEYEKSGELSYASTRNELAQMLGFPENNKTGISWVNNMVNRGYISETLHGYENGKMRKEYIYGDDFKESVYFTKNGDYREKNNETYCWTVYKNKICRTIETMIKKGELDLEDN